MKTEKKSAKKFGGIIDAYTISEAEADGAILPLIYQGRYVDMDVQKTMIDEFYKRITKPMSDDERKDFEKKAVSSKLMDENSSRVEMIALDIVDHYKEYFQHTGLKGQIVMPSKYTAMLCYQAIDLLGGVNAAVIISETSYEDGDDNLPEQKKLVAAFLKEERRLYGSLEACEKQVIQDFKKKPDGIELLIVVDKLLTGFDAPRNTVLYLAKQLKDHNLLQAIARVNRIFNGEKNKQAKTSGIIIDYSKNALNLRNAMELFSNYDDEDIQGALISTKEKVIELDTLYQHLHDTFKGLKTPDECFNFLKSDELKRNKYYEEVNRFIKVFSTCLSLYDFNQYVSADKLKSYSLDLKRFVEIKKTTQLAMAEKVDFSKYRDQLHKILDKYVTASGVDILSKEINLSDVREFNQFVDDQANGMSDRSKAEAIAAQTKKVIHERYARDEAFYGRFSDEIDRLLQKLKDAKRDDIAQLLGAVKDIQKQVDNYEADDIPNAIKTQQYYHPYYRNLKQYFDTNDDILADIVKDIVEIIEQEKCVDWDKNITVHRKIADRIDDYLYDHVKAVLNVELSREQMDKILNDAWNIAVQNKG
jgi:type I restriction enzyme R subunit